ncbi:DNA-3-methyladenine glycosylase [Marinilactibacillus kalidii]|uniref:DNA-3-methyladenine glycosylase n=1 Tax=Marinilactibacillus kalidii TaxID=2820274 RepID=UPI001ABECC8E|nr:DNA-3-methyladenine glycosylase [Marinilactibacillus kalidii]
MYYKDFYNHVSTEEIARQLLGCLVVKETDKGRVSGWIVETEAYLGVEDEAAHTFNGRKTPRVSSMYESAGTIYIYSMHTHRMLNVVTQPEGVPQAVLIRAIEPYEGITVMQENRLKHGRELTNGPGKLTKAMGIELTDDGYSIFSEPLFIESTSRKIPNQIGTSPRIGIPNKGKWTDAPLRYTVVGNPFVSRKVGKVSVDNGWKTVLE